LAIDLTPASQKIERALEAGMVAAKARIPPDQLYAWFGPHDGMKPKGFIMTRVVGLRVLAAHFALRGEIPTERE